MQTAAFIAQHTTGTLNSSAHTQTSSPIYRTAQSGRRQAAQAPIWALLLSFLVSQAMNSTL